MGAFATPKRINIGLALYPKVSPANNAALTQHRTGVTANICVPVDSGLEISTVMKRIYGLGFSTKARKYKPQGK